MTVILEDYETIYIWIPKMDKFIKISSKQAQELRA